MKLSNQITGTTNSQAINGISQYPLAVAAAGYAPAGYDNSTRRTTQERHAMGCRNVVVQPSKSGETWQCVDVVTGEIRLFPSSHDPLWCGEMAAAEFGGEFK
jgi:hypothetical protein